MQCSRQGNFDNKLELAFCDENGMKHVVLEFVHLMLNYDPTLCIDLLQNLENGSTTESGREH